MKYAFIDSNGVLTSWGFAEANGEDTRIEVADDFDHAPGSVRYDGSEWGPYDPQAIAPSVVSMRQARLALLEAGLLDDVAAALGALPSPQKEAAQINWEFAATVDRSSPLVATLAQALGLGAADLDQLFTTAAAL